MAYEKKILFARLKKVIRMPAAIYPENFNTGVYNKFSFDGKTYTLIKHDRGERESVSYWGGGFLARTSEPSVEVRITNNYDGNVATYKFTGLQNILLRWRYFRCVGKRL